MVALLTYLLAALPANLLLEALLWNLLVVSSEIGSFRTNGRSLWRF
jgi:hypothetical protein